MDPTYTANSKRINNIHWDHRKKNAKWKLGDLNAQTLSWRIIYVISYSYHITLFEIFIFVQKFNFDFLRKLSIFFWVKNSWKCCDVGLFSCWQLWFPENIADFFYGWKTRENVVVLDFLAVDNFDFTRKIVKTLSDENNGFLWKLNFWTKIWLFE